MKIWFDTEFYEDGKTIELISIGLVNECGETYYAEFIEGYEHWYKNPWVSENVIPHLKVNQNVDVCPEFKSRSRIAKEIVEFVGEKPEFWAYYADYDWVALCQLYGTMMDLPKGWPMFCMDLQQLAAWKGITKPIEQTSVEHNALNDALWARDYYKFMN